MDVLNPPLLSILIGMIEMASVSDSYEYSTDLKVPVAFLSRNAKVWRLKSANANTNID